MDTRSKIIPPDKVLTKGPSLQFAKGWFDVLTAEHCQLLAAAKPPGSTLVVLVHRESEAHPTPMTVEGRSQMVAALGCVDWVCPCDASQVQSVLKTAGAESAVDIDGLQTRDVIGDVFKRHGGR